MEQFHHVQYQLRSSGSDSPQGPDRSKPVVPDVLPRRRMRPLCEQPANTFTRSTIAAQFESIEPFDDITNSDQRPSVLDHASESFVNTRTGLATWQQLVVAAYIEKRMGESITVPALARFVYLSSYRFSRAFKRSFGIPPHRYLVQRRIERAKVLLASSAWSISEIGLALGFSQASSFSAAFRNVTGIAPTEYRRTQR